MGFVITNMKKLLPVLISLSITPALFAQYIPEGIRDGNEDKRMALFLGIASIVSFGAFIKVNYNHYVLKYGEGEGRWWCLLFAFLFGYSGYTI